MRVLQIFVLALLAVAARADVQPCQLTFLGSGVTCTEGALTFNLVSNAPSDTIVEPIAGGLALIGNMAGGTGGTLISLAVTVPAYWTIEGTIFNWPRENVIDIPDGGLNTTGIFGLFIGYSPNGTQTTFQPDGINEVNYNSPCLACGPIEIFYAANDFPFDNDALSTALLKTGTRGGPATVERWEIGGFRATAPEPSALVLLATALALGWIRISDRCRASSSSGRDYRVGALFRKR